MGEEEGGGAVGSPRMRLAMLSQVKGYLENLKDSIDSIRDEVLNKSHRAAQDAEYPAYGVTGPNKDLSPSGDRKLAQSAHMYHYQHQKQQMIALEKSSGGERHGSTSDVDSEEDGEENEYTVYECPGLAPTGEMEVKNPLFHDDPTPATPSIRKETEQDHEEDKSNK
ncbi:neural proliferation differentiation and control protein 1-like [Scylla paramamosain]|uniref:neural proliferation differentiation and control protein 1-like n=1 Tax=Scylla paramamosain TaxID=85552 RepID=UPI0030830573